MNKHTEKHSNAGKVKKNSNAGKVKNIPSKSKAIDQKLFHRTLEAFSDCV